MPPDCAVNQPSKSWPLHTGVGSSPYVAPAVTTLDSGDTLSPPFRSNVTVYCGGSPSMKSTLSQSISESNSASFALTRAVSPYSTYTVFSAVQS